MHFADNYRHVGTIDIAPLREAVLALGEDDWNASTSRQENHPVHVRTRTIHLLYDEEYHNAAPTRWPLMERFETVLAPAMDRIRDFYASAAGSASGQGYFARIVLVRLAAGGEIASHTDTGALLRRAHRIHLPVITNDQMLFAIRGDIRHLPPGELWEINNRRSHAVRNGGPDRIHAILDYLVPGEIIDDPDGTIVV